ncbi:hypothetical protein OSB04_un001223 [Centaurea solstitialis]|uniref:F-ATPase protein 6 n=1 Tax=Centaurea solstitialis TaxID=347529 RepID=A0AA38SFY0_9ASTR|nr:hypothetical protein OSB04_un001223 [Centaurea solstitialis]
MKDIVKVQDIVEARGLYSASPQNRMMDPLASSDILTGVPLYKVPSVPYKELWGDKITDGYCSATVYVPAEISDPVVISKITRLNHFLLNVNFDFCKGTLDRGYIQWIQKELQSTPMDLLSDKLESVFHREYGKWGLIYNSFYQKATGSANPFNFHQEYMNRCDYWYNKVLWGPNPFSSAHEHVEWCDYWYNKALSGPSPLDQFSILPLIPMKIGNLYFSFTNSSLFMLLTLSFVLLLIHFVTKKGGGNLVPNAWQSLVELIYDFVLNLGMIPYSFTVTTRRRALPYCIRKWGIPSSLVCEFQAATAPIAALEDDLRKHLSVGHLHDTGKL